MYSFSTCWNSHRHTDGRAMLREIRSMGFEWAELSHGIRLSLLPGVIEAVDAGEIKISSLHNFCPLPMGVNQAAPNLYLFSSLDTRERENAYRHSVKTIETAARLKAEVVVLHMGCLDMKDYTEKLLEMVQKGQKETPRYAALCETVMEKREQKKEPYVQFASEMLDRLAKLAEERGLKLGIENRQALEEIPLDSDFELLLREFDRPCIGYWHDCGHAQIKENLGFIEHRAHLETMSPRLLGFHVHDVEFPGHDHRPPGTGTVDFAALKPLVKPEHIKVFELSPSLSARGGARGGAYPPGLGCGMKRLKAWWSVGWRVAVCVLLLLWIFHTIFLNEGRLFARQHGLQWAQMSRSEQWHLAWSNGPRELWRTLSQVYLGALLLSVVLQGVVLGVGVVRWRLVLETQGIYLSFGRAARISLVAQFFNAFLLGSTGGDLIKAYYAARETHHQKTEAVTTVFVDRLVGLWAMLFFAGVMMLPNMSMLTRHRDMAASALMILGMLVTLTIVLTVAFWGGISKRLPRARHYLRRLPKGHLLEKSLDSCRQFGKQKVFLSKAVALSLGLNVIMVLQIAVLGAGMGLSIRFVDLFMALLLIVPIISCISAVPITPNGLGVREGLFVLMLGVIAVPDTAALSISLLASAEGIFWSLLGGFLYMGLREKEHLAEVTQATPVENG